jgi:hypothetical protein
MGPGRKGKYFGASVAGGPVKARPLAIAMSGGEIVIIDFIENDHAVKESRADHAISIFQPFKKDPEAFFPYLQRIHLPSHAIPLRFVKVYQTIEKAPRF